MVMLKKEEACYKNNGSKLESIKVPIVNTFEEDKEFVKADVMLVPMTRPELKEFFNMAQVVADETGETNVASDKDTDTELIKKHITEPKFEYKELEFLKPRMTRNLVYTILKASEQNIDAFIKLQTTVADITKE